MVCWAKALGAWVLLTTALLATATGTNGQGKRMRRDTAMLAPGPPGNMSEAARNCARLKVVLNKTAELWTRPLSREEYYRRNFMWLRCRSMHTKFFDMGGAWFGRGDKALKDIIGARTVTWQFNYVRGDWGDATLFLDHWHERSLAQVVIKMTQLASKASLEFNRNFYIIDCPKQEKYSHYATERTGVHFPNPDQIKPKHGNRAIYNSKMKALDVGRFKVDPAWPKKHKVYDP